MELIKLLKQLRKIEPDPAYSERSLNLILSSGRPVKRETGFKEAGFWAWLIQPSFRRTLAAEVSGFVIILIILGVYYFQLQNKNSLVVQADEINASIQLKLNEIQYLIQNDNLETSTTSSLAISLGQAEEELKIAEAELQNNDIEKSLEKIKAVQKIFEEINPTHQ